MKGKYNNDISWPFKKTVCMSLRANSGNRKNFDLKLKPDNNPSCYEKPQQSNNMGAGQPQFISHVELIGSCEYIHDDGITIHVRIL